MHKIGDLVLWNWGDEDSVLGIIAQIDNPYADLGNEDDDDDHSVYTVNWADNTETDYTDGEIEDMKNDLKKYLSGAA
jgi:hypothetical protein